MYAQVNRTRTLQCSWCNRVCFSLLVHSLTSVSCALSRKLPKMREVVKGTTTCFTNASTKWRMFDVADLPTGGGPRVLLRAVRRCTWRGHSDSARWNDDNREHRRCQFSLLATAYLSSLTRQPGLRAQEYRVLYKDTSVAWVCSFSCGGLVEAGRLFKLYFTHQ